LFLAGARVSGSSRAIIISVTAGVTATSNSCRFTIIIATTTIFFAIVTGICLSQLGGAAIAGTFGNFIGIQLVG
jgi:hypothetical protein